MFDSRCSIHWVLCHPFASLLTAAGPESAGLRPEIARESRERAGVLIETTAPPAPESPAGLRVDGRRPSQCGGPAGGVFVVCSIRGPGSAYGLPVAREPGAGSAVARATRPLPRGKFHRRRRTERFDLLGVWGTHAADTGRRILVPEPMGNALVLSDLSQPVALAAPCRRTQHRLRAEKNWVRPQSCAQR